MCNTVVFGDTVLAFEECGQGPALLLLHGGFVSRLAWAEQMREFRTEYRVVAPDLRGHGDSSRNAGAYSIEQMGRDAWDVLDHLGIEQAVIWGHSLGGMIAQEMAYKEPERVQGLILEETTYSTGSTRKERLQTGIAKAMVRALSVNRIAKWSSRELGALRPDVGAYIWGEMQRFSDDHAHFLRLWDAVFAFDSRAWVHQIMCPTLILTAKANEATTRQGRRMVELMPRARMETLARAGHMLHWDAPNRVHKLVRSFLNERVFSQVRSNSV